MVARFDMGVSINGDLGQPAAMVSKTGEFVRYTAYATLRAENEQLRRERDTIRNETLEEAAKVAETRFTLETVGKSASGKPYASGGVAIFAGGRIAAAIRNLAGKIPHRKVAKIFGVDRDTIHRIQSRKSWQNLP